MTFPAMTLANVMVSGDFYHKRSGRLGGTGKQIKKKS